MVYAIIIIAVVVVAAGVGYSIMRTYKINKNGVEATATVSRIDTDTDTDSDGTVNKTETYYVTYTNPEGQTVEAKLGNPPAYALVGTQLKVKYLPEKPKYVQWVK